MPYIILKNIIESVISNFACPQCKSNTNEQAIHISAISSQGIDINITCHTCGANSQLNAEINTVASQLLANEHGRKFFEGFIKNAGSINTSMIHGNNNKKSGIQDEDINKIHANLKSIKTIKDLMHGDDPGEAS